METSGGQAVKEKSDINGSELMKTVKAVFLKAISGIDARKRKALCDVPSEVFCRHPLLLHITQAMSNRSKKLLLYAGDV